MSPHLKYISKILLTSLIVFGVSGVFAPQIIKAQGGDPGVVLTPDAIEIHQAALDSNDPGFWERVGEGFMAKVANLILKFASLLTGIAALVLNGVIFHTVVNVSENYEKIKSIETTWKVVRDIANMGFIFVLLYAAIKQIIGASQDNQKLIVRVITVAILINFSLFFTRVVIDISNVLALTFYDAIAPEALDIDAPWAQQKGLSNAFMQHLNLQTIWQAPNLDTGTIITIGIMGTIMLLIAAFVFFAVAILFIIRYVILILVLVLSPIAFVAYILPEGTGIDEHRKRWVNALIGQSFFAPIYFMLTWVTLNILSGITSSFIDAPRDTTSSVTTALGSLVMGNAGAVVNTGAFLMLINFIIVIVLLITSLIVAKSWADRAGGGMSKLTGWATGVAGGATIGLAGFAGRKTIGRFADARANNQDLKDRAAAGSRWAQLQLAASRKTAGSSFDFRATRAGSATVGVAGAEKGAGKGGFTEFKKKQAEAEEKYAKSLAPGDEMIDQVEQELKRAQEAVKNTTGGTPERAAAERRVAKAQNRVNDLKGVDAKKRKSELEDEKQAKISEHNAVQREKEILEKIKQTEEKLVDAKEADDMALYQALASELSALNESRKGISREAKTARETIERDYEEHKRRVREIPGAAARRKNAYAESIENSIWAAARGYNTAAAAQIRKGKSKEKQLAEAYKKLAEDETPTETTPEVTPPATPPTP